MWWSRHEPVQRLAKGQDVAGRRREILVVSADDNPAALAFPLGHVAALDSLQTGRLPGALRREAVLAFDQPTTQNDHQHAIPAERVSA